MDYVLKYMEDHNVPMTRENYITLNWMGMWDAEKPLPAELEAEMPEQLQLRKGDGSSK